MGRSKVLNKPRKRNHHEKDGRSAGKSRKAAVAGDTSGDASGDASRDASGDASGEASGSGGGEERTTKGGPWRKLSRFLLAYPFVTITIAVILPKIIPMCTRWVILRSGLIGPIVPVHAEKQLLVVGTVGSGTAQMSKDLMELGVEVRHPLRTVAYLAYKSAPSRESAGQDCSKGRQRLSVVRALFPDKVVRSQLRGNGPAFEDFEWAKVSGNCLEVWGWYWVVYNRAMLQGVDGWYRVEDTTPSKVASLAGFSSTSIDEELGFAKEEEGRRKTEGEANQPRDGYTEENIGGFEITWEGLAACSGELLQEMSDLALELGYEGAPGLPPRVTANDGDPSLEAGDGLEAGEGEEETKKGWRGVFQRLRRRKGGGRGIKRAVVDSK